MTTKAIINRVLITVKILSDTEVLYFTLLDSYSFCFAIFSFTSLEQPLFAGMLRYLVCNDNQYDADHALENTGCGTNRIVALADAPLEHVDINGLGYALHKPVAQQVLNFKSGIEHISHIHQKKYHDGRLDSGEGDMPDFGPASGAVDGSGFIKRRIDGRNGG